MGISKDLSKVIELSKEFAISEIHGQKYYEKDTPEFFNALIGILNGINEDIDIEKMTELIQPNFEAIYMLMKASKNKEINCHVYALDEDGFRLRNAHSLNALKIIL